MPNSVDRPSLSRSIEDYLKVIYKLELESGSAQTSAIADALAIAPPSVSGMVKRLADAELVTHVPYRGVELTEAGRRQALRMLRRHRILESYLIGHLGYDWDDVDREAERLEHAVSDDLVERMAVKLGNPTHDPHGAPIPSAAGTIDPTRYLPMTEIEVGLAGRFRMIGDADPERLRFIASLGLRPGAEFRVLDRQPFNGPVTIELDGDRKEVIGFALASSLQCEQLEEPTLP
ncbi:MAG: metal-dependent transcriptional regulator [Gemmatimonadetes bacterium]|nr:metal-dependent transcriptional regulator [Gemmatimonadota bacterium]